MSGIPTVIPIKAFDQWFFGSPEAFPTVLTLMQLKALVWAVSADYNETPMAGLLAYQFGADTGFPAPVEFTRLGGSASPWAFCAKDNAQTWNDVFSLLYQDVEGQFTYVFRIQGNVLSTSFRVESDPANIEIGFNFVELGRAAFAGTNFQAIALRNPKTGGNVLAIIDVTYGLSSPAWAVSFEQRVLYFPAYSPGRPVNPAFGLTGVPRTGGEIAAMTATTVVVLAAILAALPFVREVAEYLAHQILEFLSQYFTIAGYASTALGAASSFV